MNNKENFIADMNRYLMIFNVEDVADELDNLGFFNAPASINHHGNHDGGLYEHSYEVMHQLLYLTKRLDLTWSRPESPYIIGMFHDICKCDNYKKSRSRIPNMIDMGLGNDDGCYEEKWEYNKNSVLSGHGEKSVIMTQNILGRLTKEEVMCIRWHMGAFDDKENWQYYSRAVSSYPNVLFTHTADMIASQICTI